ncbi:flagellar filament capping protein FliD [Clostridium butyricum]|uniref:flagellar filament capping protein FliD n=1 Tax=Clostridium butyricum TaxID=1492 RepID=UPI003D35217F
MRITGLATGLDMDEIIKNSMKPYRIKIQQQQQNKEVVEIKQKLYRDVIKDGREFYNKYLDVAKSDSLLLQKNWSSVSFVSSDESAVNVTSNGGAIKENYKVSVEQLAEKASGILKDPLPTGTEQTITTGGFDIKFNIGKDSTETIKNFNTALEEKRSEIKNDKTLSEDKKKEQLKSLNIDAKYSQISGGIIFEAKEFGQGGFLINGTEAKEKMLIATITNSKGDKFTINDKTNTQYSNTITVDGATFNFSDVTTKNGIDNPIKITGKTDTKEVKDKLVSFVNDYNKLMEKLNTVTGTKHDKGYAPLTDEQKKEMSESEIKLWNEKVEKGQLYKDSDITRIANSMKGTMRSLIGGTKLESVGIKPVGDYSGPLNGTFTIDEDKLTKALEENAEGVMNLFIGNPDSKDVSQKGILHQLKDTVNKEFCVSNSALIEKAGYEGTSFSNNTLTKKISDYENKIKDMEKDFSRKEQALYTKYATLETMMNKLNSQQSNLMSQLGMS